MISARVIADSVSPTGKRITTLVLRYHRFFHQEFLTHRMLSRNSASSRAIPVNKMLARVLSDPAIPIWWGKNQPGMVAKSELSTIHKWIAIKLWILAGMMMCVCAKIFQMIGLHKQTANRILEPWVWMETVVTATEWGHMFNLRMAPDAQVEFKQLVECIINAMNESVPVQLNPGEWHLPFVNKYEVDTYGYEDCLKLSVARCARVSLLNHDGTIDPHKDKELWTHLKHCCHASPFEHQATPLSDPCEHSGNFIGWLQYRKSLDNEYKPECPYIK